MNLDSPSSSAPTAQARRLGRASIARRSPSRSTTQTPSPKASGRQRRGAPARRPQACRRPVPTRPQRRQHVRIREHLLRTVAARHRANRQTARLHHEGRLPRNRDRRDQHPPRTQAGGGRGTPCRRGRSEKTLDSGVGEPPRDMGGLRHGPDPRQLRDRAHRDRTQDQARSHDGHTTPAVDTSVAGNCAERPSPERRTIDRDREPAADMTLVDVRGRKYLTANRRRLRAKRWRAHEEFLPPSRSV